MVVGDSTLSSSHSQLPYFPPLLVPSHMLLFPAASVPYYNLKTAEQKTIF
jgi:hypothetical protein